MRMQLLATLSAMALSAGAAQPTWAQVPERVVKRAQQVAQMAGGSGTTVERVWRIEDKPGLSQATGVQFTNGSGQGRQLVMLPDGKHFIPGPVLSMSQAERHSGSNQAGSKAGGSKRAAGSYQLDGNLKAASFTQAARGLFDSMDSAPEHYFRVITEAPAVTQGTGGEDVYVLVDTNCPYCRKEYDKLQPLIESGQLTVHWVPVDGPSKPPYRHLLALLDPGTDNERKVKRLDRFFQGGNFSGELVEAETATKYLNKTTKLLQMLRSTRSDTRFAGTPQTLYKTPNGQIRHLYGAADTNWTRLKNDLSVF